MIVRLSGVPGHLVFPFCLILLALGDANAQTIEDTLTIAYRNNPTLLGQRAKVRATDEQVPQALSNWRPDIEITGSAGLEGITNTNASTTGTNRGQHREPTVVALFNHAPGIRQFQGRHIQQDRVRRRDTVLVKLL